MGRLIGSVGLAPGSDEGTDLTTKGDLHGYGSSNTRIPIGSNDQVLTADSAQALGLKWATPAGGEGKYELIGSTSLSGGANGTIELSFTAVDQSDVAYFVAVLNGSKTSTSSELYLELNSLTSNYNIQSLQSSGTSVGAVERTSQSQWNFDNQASTQVFVIVKIICGAETDTLLAQIESSTDKLSTMISVANNSTSSQTSLSKVSFKMSSSTYKQDTRLDVFKVTI
jgi:hypothetical protein